jgi:hypothetical protein
MQFGSSNTAVFFKMRVAGVLHIFQFETKQVLSLCWEIRIRALAVYRLHCTCTAKKYRCVKRGKLA